jgi:signal transduction histidine kinase/DNA-binding response OmpR family regulator
MKILVIQDGNGIDSLVSRALREQGHELTFCDGRQAAARCCREDFPLVILDVAWPAAERAQAISAFRRDLRGDESFILVAIQLGEVDQTPALLLAGADDILIKENDLGRMRFRLAVAEHHARRFREHQQTELSLNNQAQQQVAIAALGQLALSDQRFEEVASLVATFVVQMLGVEFCSILEYDARAETLRFRAGFGWREGILGRTVRLSESDDANRHVLFTKEPLMIGDLSNDPRFNRDSYLREHGVASGMSVAIQGKVGALGLLNAYSARLQTFAEDRLHFLQSLANVLGAVLERERSEAAIRKLASFPTLNPNPILELTCEGALSFANVAAENLAHALDKAAPEQILPPDYVRMVRECLATGQKREHERVRHEQRIIEWSLLPITELRVVHCYARDITAQQSLETQVQHLQRIESIGQLAASLAHDYNNVLTVIHGHITIALEDADLTAELEVSLKRVLQAAERASALTRQLLTFSRKQAVQRNVLDLDQLIGEMARLLDRVLGSSITLECHSSEDLPLVEADAGLLEQVLMNLAVNARDAMPEGGRLGICAEKRTVHDVEAREHPEARPGEFVCLSVTDTGCGMDEATRQRIFEPFFTTKDPGKGTGLGLATVYGIVKQHQGWVDVRSQLGQGTAFLIFLPCLAGGASSPPSGVRAEGKHTRATVLLVEDEPDARHLAKLALEQLGCVVVDAGSGREALEIWKEQQGKFDLLLSDLVLPDDVTGFDLAERLQRETPRLPVIIASGYVADRFASRMAQQPNFLFIQKPYGTEALGKAVRRCLEDPAGAAV